MAAVAPEARASLVSRRAVARRRRAARRHVASGVVWIAVVAVLLAGVVAVNVAVLRLNLRLGDVSRERAKLRADNAALQSRLSRAAAAGPLELLAEQRLGVVPADPAQTTFLRLGR